MTDQSRFASITEVDERHTLIQVSAVIIGIVNTKRRLSRQRYIFFGWHFHIDFQRDIMSLLRLATKAAYCALKAGNRDFRLIRNECAKTFLMSSKQFSRYTVINYHNISATTSCVVAFISDFIFSVLQTDSANFMCEWPRMHSWLKSTINGTKSNLSRRPFPQLSE